MSAAEIVMNIERTSQSAAGYEWGLVLPIVAAFLVGVVVGGMLQVSNPKE